LSQTQIAKVENVFFCILKIPQFRIHIILASLITVYDSILHIYCYDGQVMVQSGNTTIPLDPSREASSQPKSPMDVSDDKQDEDLLKLNEDEF
jgi:hypothetical protein